MTEGSKVSIEWGRNEPQGTHPNDGGEGEGGGSRSDKKRTVIGRLREREHESRGVRKQEWVSRLSHSPPLLVQGSGRRGRRKCGCRAVKKHVKLASLSPPPHPNF